MDSHRIRQQRSPGVCSAMSCTHARTCPSSQAWGLPSCSPLSQCSRTKLNYTKPVHATCIGVQESANALCISRSTQYLLIASTTCCCTVGGSNNSMHNGLRSPQDPCSMYICQAAAAHQCASPLVLLLLPGYHPLSIKCSLTHSRSKTLSLSLTSTYATPKLQQAPSPRERRPGLVPFWFRAVLQG